MLFNFYYYCCKFTQSAQGMFKPLRSIVNMNALLSWEDFDYALSKLFVELHDFFGDFPYLDSWEIMRLDVCYAWKYKSRDDVLKVLDLLKKYGVSRKKTAKYDTSIHQVGSWSTIKFYQKGDEFKNHDFRFLCDTGHYDLACILKDYSTGVLRFEVGLRKPQLQYITEKIKIYNKDLTKKLVRRILQSNLKKFLKGMNGKVLNSQQVYLKLVNKYGIRKARNLLNFYLLFNSSVPVLYESFVSVRKASTIRGYFHDLRLADIGLPIIDSLRDYDLRIPSSYVVMNADFLPAVAGKKKPSTYVTPVEALKFD